MHPYAISSILVGHMLIMLYPHLVGSTPPISCRLAPGDSFTRRSSPWWSSVRPAGSAGENNTTQSADHLGASINGATLIAGWCWMVYLCLFHGKSKSKMDENCGYPHLWKPSCMDHIERGWGSSNFKVSTGLWKISEGSSNIRIRQ